MSKIVAVTNTESGLRAFAADGRVFVALFDDASCIYDWREEAPVPLVPPKPKPPTPDGWVEVAKSDMLRDGDAVRFDIGRESLWEVCWTNHAGGIWVRHIEGERPKRFTSEGTIDARQVTQVFRRTIPNTEAR